MTPEAGAHGRARFFFVRDAAPIETCSRRLQFLAIFPKR
jgi:hypothetical protein